MKRETIIKLLKAYGHSAFKAVEIAIDYERGDKHAKDWVAAVIGYAVRSAL